MAYYGYLHCDDAANGESRMDPRHQFSDSIEKRYNKQTVGDHVCRPVVEHVTVGDHVCRPVVENKPVFYRGTPINPYDYGGNGTIDTATKGWRGGDIYEMDTNGWTKQSGGIHELGNNWGSKPRGATSAIGTNEWSRPSDSPYDTNTNGWGASIGVTDITGTGGWGRPNSRTNNITTNKWSRPTETNIHQPFYDDSYEKNESSMDGYHTTMATTDGRGMPTQVGWAKPSTYKSDITRPTSDIGAVVGYLRESVRPSSVTTMTPWQGQISAPSLSYPIEEIPTGTIDSKEAARRYGNLPVTPPTINPTAAIIDSKEAARKYNGLFI